ncbi:hypothetical protein C8Q74DRAFT_1282526 [Fomes fomentarius]|nr:hypothetical protein C8Q74DRAFT_1282526 [Fomes fomentarius]
MCVNAPFSHSQCRFQRIVHTAIKVMRAKVVSICEAAEALLADSPVLSVPLAGPQERCGRGGWARRR